MLLSAGRLSVRIFWSKQVLIALSFWRFHIILTP